MTDKTSPEFETNETAETAVTAALPDALTTDGFAQESPSLAGSLGAGVAESLRDSPSSTAPGAGVAESLRDSPSSTARTRWAGIVWGTIFAAIGLATALIVTSPERRDAFGGWLASLTPGGFVLVGVLALGCLILVLGLLAAARRLQRRRVAS